MTGPAQRAGESPVRASDADRELAADILCTGYSAGRLTRAELDDRITAAYGATTRADLAGLTADLPAVGHPGGMPGSTVPGPLLPAGREFAWLDDRCLLVCLLIACPPAGVACWILAARAARARRARELAGSVTAGAWPARMVNGGRGSSGDGSGASGIAGRAG